MTEEPPPAAAELPPPAAEPSPDPDPPQPPEHEPVPAAVAPPPALRPYDLPSARGVVAYGLSLAYRATSDLRRASLYIGLLTLAILGPPVVVVIELVAKLHLTDAAALEALVSDPSTAAEFGAVLLLVYAALGGWIAVAIDGQLIAIALLASKAANRPYTLRDATVRARQVFWRLIRGGCIAGLFVVVIELIITVALLQLVGSNSSNGFVAGIIATLIAAPLGYLSTGIVLGDVGAREALKRSIALARARPRIAIVVALFAVITNAIQSFALGAGAELVIDAANAGHIDVTAGVVPLVLTILVVLAFVMAFGSLTFTISAIVAAPQVAAFLGLTYYSAGLDRAFVVRPAAPKFRWVTRPMLALIVILSLLSAVGIVSVGSQSPLVVDELVTFVTTAAPGHQAFISRGKHVVTDPIGDETGPNEPAIDLARAESAFLPVVPPWLLDGPFACSAPHVACDPDSLENRFGEGGLLVLLDLGGPFPTVPSGHVLSWSVAFDVPGYEQSSPADWDFPGNVDVVVEDRGGSLRIYDHDRVLGLGYLQTRKSAARATWVGQQMAFLIPASDIDGAEGWDVVTSTGTPDGTTSRDRLSTSLVALLPFDDTTYLLFPDSAPAFPTF